MKPVFSGPAKRILSARATDPETRMRPLHRLGINRHVLIIVKLAFEVNRLVRPCLQHDLDAFIHPPGRLLLIDAEFFVLVRLTALADTKSNRPVEITSTIA